MSHIGALGLGKKCEQLKSQFGVDELPLSQIDSLYQKQNGKRLKRGETKSSNVLKETLSQVPEGNRSEFLAKINKLGKINRKAKGQIENIVNQKEEKTFEFKRKPNPTKTKMVEPEPLEKPKKSNAAKNLKKRQKAKEKKVLLRMQINS